MEITMTVLLSNAGAALMDRGFHNFLIDIPDIAMFIMFLMTAIFSLFAICLAVSIERSVPQLVRTELQKSQDQPPNAPSQNLPPNATEIDSE